MVRAPSIWVSWGILLLSLAALVNSLDHDKGGCVWLPNTKDEPKCPAGDEMIFGMRYKNGQNTAWCCEPGARDAPKRRAQANKCLTTGCVAPGKADPCNTELDPSYNLPGKAIVYEETKRESCSQGEVFYCCPKGSMGSALDSLVGAELNELPHMALLDLAGGQCGGTIYNKRWIITASHCVVDTHFTHEPRPVTPEWGAKVGRNLRDTPMPENDYTIIKAVFHPKFSGLKSSPEQQVEPPVNRQTYYDIALLQTDRDIKFGPNVKAIPLATLGLDEIKHSGVALAPGWGTSDTGDVVDSLQKTNLIIRRDEACFSKGKAWPRNANRTEQLLCVGGVVDGVYGGSTGPGDSGGPALCRDADGFAALCGLVSFGGNFAKCIEEKITEKCVPNVFTEVGYFADWVEEVAGKQDETTLHKVQLYGEVVKGNEAEHQVRVTSASGKPCGGTLIAPDTVVTAAHCIADGSGKPLSGLKVWSGVRDLSVSQGTSNAVKSIATLDGFQLAGSEVNVEAQGNNVFVMDNHYSNDLGVIKLKEPVKISADNLPSLPGAAVSSGSALEFAFPRNTTWGGELRKRDFVIVDKKDCQTRWDHLGFMGMVKKLDDNILCGVEKYSGGSTCDRELGGGLICKGASGRDELCGVQGHRYCTWSIPNELINVGKVSSWIKAAMEQL